MTTRSGGVDVPLERIEGRCRSYRPGTICADGFVQKPYCSGRAGCHACGQINDRALPHCMRDELPDHMAREDGSPLFYALPNTRIKPRCEAASD